MIETMPRYEQLLARPLSRVFRKVYAVSSLAAHGFYNNYYQGARMYFEDAVDAPRYAKEKAFDVHMKALELEGKIQAATFVGARVLTTPADPVVLYNIYHRASLNVPGMVFDSAIPLHERGIIAYWLFMKLCSWTGNPLMHAIPETKSNRFIRAAGKQLIRTVIDPREELPVTVYKSVVVGEELTGKAVDLGIRAVKKAVHVARRLYEEPVELLCDTVDRGIDFLDKGYQIAGKVAHGVNAVVDSVPPLSYVKQNAISAGEILLQPVLYADELLSRSQEVSLPQEFVALEYRGVARRRLN